MGPLFESYTIRMVLEIKNDPTEPDGSAPIDYVLKNLGLGASKEEP